MIIDRLLALPSAPTTGDELPIERGTGAYKIDYNALASAIIAQTQRDIAIVVEGNKTTHTGGAAVGQYVIVHNSTISGITDSLYKAVQAIPQNTAITNAYLAAVSGGGLNELNSKITNSQNSTATVVSNYATGTCSWRQLGKLVFVVMDITITTVAGVQVPIITNLPIPILVGNGPWIIAVGEDGKSCRLQINALGQVYSNYGAMPTTQGYTGWCVYEASSFV